jgi:hypothetical protein
MLLYIHHIWVTVASPTVATLMVGWYLAFHWLYHSENSMVYITLLYKSSEYLISAGVEFFYQQPAQLGETTGRLPFWDGVSRSSL